MESVKGVIKWSWLETEPSRSMNVGLLEGYPVLYIIRLAAFTRINSSLCPFAIPLSHSPQAANRFSARLFQAASA